MGQSDQYSDEEKQILLKLARETMEAKLRKETAPDVGDFPDKLREVRSCFVTIHKKDGSLRGCIGNINAFEQLAENVRSNAQSSAFGDPRFPAVSSLEELADLVIEISVLTPSEPIASPEEFIVGEHGIILKKDGRSAVFLPQVAPEQGWDTDLTLTHLSRKAGLPLDAWKSPDAEFEVFRAIVFSEPR